MLRIYFTTHCEVGTVRKVEENSAFYDETLSSARTNENLSRYSKAQGGVILFRVAFVSPRRCTLCFAARCPSDSTGSCEGTVTNSILDIENTISL